MALEAIITTDNLRDAGIAASMAANPNALPEPSIWFQDFNFGETMWDAAYGNVDGGSVSGVGEAVADIAIENVLALEEKRRKEDDPAKDAGMITELAERQREEMRRVTYQDGKFFMYGLEIDEEDLEAEMEESAGELDEHARKYGWDEATKAQMAVLYASFDQASGQERAVIFEEMREVGGERWAEDRAREAHERRTTRPSNQISASETRDAEIAVEVDSEQDFVVARQSTLDDETAVVENIAVRSDMSIGDNPFADTRSPNSEFNSQAAGIQVAEANPPQSTPSLNGPVLS